MLNEEKLELIRLNVNNFKNGIDNYKNALTKVINSFNDIEIVDQFYSSGTFGQEQKAKLESLLAGITKYTDSIMGSDGLADRTINFVNRQEDLINNGQ